MEIKVLGSVSPYPKDNLNTSSFLVTDGKKKVMLDCGFGSSRKLDMLNDLRDLVVIISHFHPDHYADLLALEYASYVYHKLGYLKDRVPVYLPKAMKSKNIASGEWQTPCFFPSDPIDYDYLTDKDREGYLEFFEYDDKKTLNISDMKIEFSKMKHPVDTYAARVESDGTSIVYSADTGFNGNLKDFANNADILICEATYLTGQEKKKDNHLYAYEAGEIACDAHVKDLYLCHTFPEIDKEKYVEEAKQYFDSTHKCEEEQIIRCRKK